jgi:phosphate butyryltransferase
MITSYEQLLTHVKERPKKRVAIVAAEDPMIIEAARKAQSLDLADFTLLGDAQKIKALCEDGDSLFQLIDTEQAAQDAVALVRAGEADLLMKGRVSTGELIRAVLDREKGLREGKLLNHIAVVQSPFYHKFICISDGGINLNLTEDVFEQMVRNNAQFLKRLGNENPKFAMASLLEYVNEKMPDTVMAKKVADKLKGEFQIEGPIAPDVALFREARDRKGLASEISGDTDVLLMSHTSAANHLIKGLRFLGGCLIGGLVVGAKVPIILLSRSDDADTRFRSILLGLM